MKIFLIRPNSILRATTLPLGLGYIADAARKAGHEVELLDARLFRLSPEEAARKVREFGPEVVGVSGIHFEKQGVIDFLRAARAAGIKAPLVIGGPLVSTSGNELVASGDAAAAVIGEGESAFLAYLDHLEGKISAAQVPGLIYREQEEAKVNPVGPFLQDLDDREPAWDLIDPNRYFKLFGRSTLNMLRHSARSASVFTSRGCPFGCLYCHNTFGRKFRPRSPDSVIREIKMLKQTYGIRELEIVDDAFNVKLDRAKEIARRIRDEKLNLHISFSNGLRADHMDYELIDLLKQAGTYRINYAVESASPRIQKMIHKNLNLEKTEDIIRHTAERGIFMLGYFMMGFPGENEEEMRMTVDYALRSKLHAAGFFYVNPFPGTGLAEGLMLDDDIRKAVDNHDYTKMAVNLSAVSDERLQEIFRKAYRDFHFAPDRMWRTFKVVPKNFRTLWSVMVVAILSMTDYGNF